MNPLRGYATAAVSLLMAGLMIAVLWYRSEAISAIADKATAETERDVAIEANRQQTETLRQMREDNARSDRLLADITARLAQISDDTAQTNAKISDLEVNDATVRDYLAQPIPPELARLLNDGTRAGG